MRSRASPFIFLSFFSFLLSDTNTLSQQFIIQHDSQWKTASSPIYTSKRSITRPGHCHHNEILSTCQEAAKVPNKCVAKLSICGFLGVALAANGLSVRALVQKALRFVCCWFFLETCGFVTSAAIHWAVLLYCLILSRVEGNCFWQQNANIFLWHKPPSGALFFSSRWRMMMSKLCKVLLLLLWLLTQPSHWWIVWLEDYHMGHSLKVWVELYMQNHRFMGPIQKPPLGRFCCFFTLNEFWK